MNQQHIVIAGGSGFIGKALAEEFIRRGRTVVVLTRSPRERTDGVREIAWDGKTAGAWVEQLAGAEAVINLTGKNINCPHTPENLREITASRVDSVKAVAAALAKVKQPPCVWVQASATGFYGDTGDRLCDEAAPNGNDALSHICHDWEQAFNDAVTPTTRKVTLRIGFVLGWGGGALPVLAKLTRLFLGGAAGSGRQYISWIHVTDLIGIFGEAVAREAWSGTYNAVAPGAVTNAAFMRELRGAIGRPWSPPAPALAVKLGARLMGSEPSLALVSQRCEPVRLAQAGFQFKYPELGPALSALCQEKRH